MTISVKLTSVPTFDLNVNGYMFKNMKEVGRVSGCLELSNGKTTVVLSKKGSTGGFSEMFNVLGVDTSDWFPLRGTKDIEDAYNHVKPEGYTSA